MSAGAEHAETGDDRAADGTDDGPAEAPVRLGRRRRGCGRSPWRRGTGGTVSAASSLGGVAGQVVRTGSSQVPSDVGVALNALRTLG
ncbi:hypothetical protein SDC9_88594 [bioreactor metagenome]|uniref:Uncharacterized protein n=1 Tax=bioreactor metagenome TaxID=1076179 RepID=A0A644ZWI8_9ZZZZ